MPKESITSKAVAAVFVILAVSAIVGTVTMVIIYNIQIAPMNPTARPTILVTTTEPPPVWRLPSNLIPLSYRVTLWPHFYTKIIEVENVTSPNQTMFFEGNSTVNFHCAQTTNSIYLNTKDLNVSCPVVMNTDLSKHIEVKEFRFEGENDFLKISFLAATNMEPTYARRVFPCFDEPEMKAEFTVTIIHRKDTIALANGETKGGTSIIGDWLKTTFYPTPKMSTYLFAFTVSEFTSISSPHKDVEIKTFARPEAITAGHVHYAANITGRILSFFESYLEIEYQQKKLDQIALPDLGAGAMENWGLITYQEGGLLFEEGVSSLLHKELIANLISHELAHQWFGNLVTMKWWNNIWLNEGFATYMSYLAVDDVEPTFHMKDIFIMNDLHIAFEADALNTSRALSPPEDDIRTSFEMNGMFDTITYSKGAMVLRIFVWIIPIRVMSNTSDSILIDMVEKQVFKDAVESKNGEWILANVNCTGYYRVNYNPENWERLLTQLETNPDRIPVMNRGQLIDDAFNLARAKLVDVTLALNLTHFLRNESAFIPWESAVRNLEYFVLMFDRTEVYGAMQAYLQERVTGLYNYFKNYTYNSEVPKDHSLQHNQILAIKVACSNGLPECLVMASKMFAEWMNSNSTTNHIHPNLRSVIYCQAVATGGKKEWEFAWNKFQDSSDTSEKEQLREALSCTKKIWLLNRYLEYTLDPEKIRLMDVASTIIYIAKNVAGQALAWNFIRANWDYVSQNGPAVLITEVTRRFSTQFELEELERFAADYDVGPATRAMKQAMEQTKVNIQWLAENKDVVLEWFEGQTTS
ncbi:alanyl (membrane) aminopeptidase-like b [Symphorus nematophorus]